MEPRLPRLWIHASVFFVDEHAQEIKSPVDLVYVFPGEVWVRLGFPGILRTLRLL